MGPIEAKLWYPTQRAERGETRRLNVLHALALVVVAERDLRGRALGLGSNVEPQNHTANTRQFIDYTLGLRDWSMDLTVLLDYRCLAKKPRQSTQHTLKVSIDSLQEALQGLEHVEVPRRLGGADKGYGLVRRGDAASDETLRQDRSHGGQFSCDEGLVHPWHVLMPVVVLQRVKDFQTSDTSERQQ